MSEPAKDEAALIKAIALAALEYGAANLTMDDLAADTLAAIRAAGWAVVPARLTKDMEYDALRAENARLREALLDVQGPMYVEFVRHLPTFRCEEEP